MNIGDAVKKIQKKYPSVSISRLRFLEKEGLINPKRSKGGTRQYTSKDIDRIYKILSLQEDEYYSLKAIKNNQQLILNNKNKNIKINEYSKHDALKNQDYQKIITMIYSITILKQRRINTVKMMLKG